MSGLSLNPTTEILYSEFVLSPSAIVWNLNKSTVVLLVSKNPDVIIGVFA